MPETPTDKTPPAGGPRRGAGPGNALIGIVVVLGLLGAVYLLPPDTSLRVLREAGTLRACVPSEKAPLVTGDPDRPGIDVELLQAIAERLGLRLSLNRNSAMGRDINPRNWRITRAQCQVIAGGIVASATTRSYLETTPSHLEVGWAIVVPPAGGDLDGATVGFHAGFSGLDRIALSRFLRQRDADVSILSTREALAEGLQSGAFGLGVTDSLSARLIAEAHGWEAMWLSDTMPPLPLAFGLWKGDLTLKRELVDIIERLEREGVFGRLLDKYEVGPMGGTFHTGS